MVEQDELAKFIERQNDKDWWKKITDELNNKQIKLSEADLELLQRLRSGKFVDKSINPYDEEWKFDNLNPDEKTPLNAENYLPKRSFIPSKWERLRISKFRQAMKAGRMKTPDQLKKDQEEKEKEHQKVWDIWEDDTIVSWRPRKMPKPIVAPKRDLPMHSESFNPPEEYLFNEEEQEKWEKADPNERN